MLSCREQASLDLKEGRSPCLPVNPSINSPREPKDWSQQDSLVSPTMRVSDYQRFDSGSCGEHSTTNGKLVVQIRSLLV